MSYFEMTAMPAVSSRGACGLFQLDCLHGRMTSVGHEIARSPKSRGSGDPGWLCQASG